MGIYKELANKALESLKLDQLYLKSYEIDAKLTKVVIQADQSFYSGLTVTPAQTKSLQYPRFKDIKDILEQSLNYDEIKRAYGLAAINAIGQFLNAKTKLQTADDLRKTLLHFLQTQVKKEQKIVFIGHLKPVADALKKQAYRVEVFCRQYSDENEKVYSDIFEYEALQEAEVVVITGASLQGSTIDALLHFIQNAKIVVLAGFSAGGFLPWYKAKGITHVASLSTPKMLQNKEFEDIFNNKCYLVKL